MRPVLLLSLPLVVAGASSLAMRDFTPPRKMPCEPPLFECGVWTSNMNGQVEVEVGRVEVGQEIPEGSFVHYIPQPNVIQLRPGDYVDVVAVVPFKGRNDEPKPVGHSALRLLERVRVYALEDRNVGLIFTHAQLQTVLVTPGTLVLVRRPADEPVDPRSTRWKTTTREVLEEIETNRERRALAETTTLEPAGRSREKHGSYLAHSLRTVTIPHRLPVKSLHGRVDIYFTQETPEEQGARTFTARSLVENVTVVDSNAEYVELLVLREEVDLLLLAPTVGELTIVLRGPMDATSHVADPYTTLELFEVYDYSCDRSIRVRTASAP